MSMRVANAVQRMISDRPRIALRPLVGNEVGVRGIFDHQGFDNDAKRLRKPIWKMLRLHVDGIEDPISHCYIKIDDPPEMLRHEEIKFRAKVIEYLRMSDKSKDWSFDGNTMKDLMALRGGRWQEPNWPEDEPDELRYTFPPIRQVPPPVKAIDPFALVDLAQRCLGHGNLDTIKAAKEIAALVPQGEWENVLRMAETLTKSR